MAPFVIFIDPGTFFSGNPALKPAIGDHIKADYIYKKYLFSVSYNYNKDAIARFQTGIQKKVGKGRLRFGVDDIFNSFKFETSVKVPEQIWIQKQIISKLSEPIN
jgi:hypothetical protein